MQRFKAPDIFSEYLIIGAGSAGLLISKKLAEMKKDVWMLGSPYDSQLAKAGEITGSKILKKGTIGLQQIEKLLEEAKLAGVKHKSSNVVAVNLKPGQKEIKTQFQTFYAKKIIIATGSKQSKLKFPGEQRYFKNGISDCAVCDGNLFREHPVAIVGSHKYTANGASFLSKIASKVYLLWNSEHIPDEIQQKLSQLENLTVYSNITNLEAKGSDVLEQVKFCTGKIQYSKNVNALFVEGNPEPTTEIFPNILLQENSQYIKIKDNYETPVRNVYAFGEVVKGVSSYDEIFQEIDNFVKYLLQ